MANEKCSWNRGAYQLKFFQLNQPTNWKAFKGTGTARPEWILARGGRAEEDKPNGAWTGAGEARGGRRVEEQVHGGQGTWVTPAGAPD